VRRRRGIRRRERRKNRGRRRRKKKGKKEEKEEQKEQEKAAMCHRHKEGSRPMKVEPKNAKGCQKLEKVKKVFFLRAFQGSWPRILDIHLPEW
jgi:hypothetical protein